MSKTFNCPACGAANTFKSADSLFVVCPHCRSSIFKSDEQLTAMGKMADVIDDNSPLQLRASGVYRNQSFLVIGRVRMKWQDGFWNEWHLFFNDGKSAWLSEAQGEFALLYTMPPEASIPSPKAWELKKGFSIGDKNFVICDLKHAEVIATEGELPFRAHSGDKRFSADFRARTGAVLGSLEQDISAPEKMRAYAGTIVDLVDLKMTNLRSFDGW